MDTASSRWRIFVADEEGAGLTPIQQVDVPGWTWGTPASSGKVIWAVGDRGGAAAFGIVDRPGGHEDAREPARGRGFQPAERQPRLLQVVQLGLARHRQAGERFAGGDFRKVEVFQALAVVGAAGPGELELAGQARRVVGFARRRIARLERVVVRGIAAAHRYPSQRLRRR